MPEPPLTDREIKVLRGMMDEYESGRLLRSLIHRAGGTLIKVASALGALAVLAAAIQQLLGGR